MPAFWKGSAFTATRETRLRPNGARPVAVKVEGDGLHIVVYVSTIAAPRVLPDLESNGQAAIDFGRPTDDRACQIKGVFVGAWPASTNERAFVAAQWQAVRDNLERIGVPPRNECGVVGSRCRWAVP